jgi:hypothetical protein
MPLTHPYCPLTQDLLCINFLSGIFKSSSDTYDMYGFVVEKLPADQYANHYKVKGNNDEIFICWYADDIILAPGTEVGMILIEQDKGWKIEPIMHI